MIIKHLMLVLTGYPLLVATKANGMLLLKAGVLVDAAALRITEVRTQQVAMHIRFKVAMLTKVLSVDAHASLNGHRVHVGRVYY